MTYYLTCLQLNMSSTNAASRHNSRHLSFVGHLNSAEKPLIFARIITKLSRPALLSHLKTGYGGLTDPDKPGSELLRPTCAH